MHELELIRNNDRQLLSFAGYGPNKVLPVHSSGRSHLLASSEWFTWTRPGCCYFFNVFIKVFQTSVTTSSIADRALNAMEFYYLKLLRYNNKKLSEYNVVPWSKLPASWMVPGCITSSFKCISDSSVQAFDTSGSCCTNCAPPNFSGITSIISFKKSIVFLYQLFQ